MEIRMLGEFPLRSGSACVSDGSNRTRKVWLLTYLICYRSRPISLNEMVELLWTNEDSSSNPLNALKTMFHRVRATLEPLGGRMPGTGSSSGGTPPTPGTPRSPSVWMWTSLNGCAGRSAPGSAAPPWRGTPT